MHTAYMHEYCSLWLRTTNQKIAKFRETKFSRKCGRIKIDFNNREVAM